MVRCHRTDRLPGWQIPLESSMLIVFLNEQEAERDIPLNVMRVAFIGYVYCKGMRVAFIGHIRCKGMRVAFAGYTCCEANFHGPLSMAQHLELGERHLVRHANRVRALVPLITDVSHSITN